MGADHVRNAQDDSRHGQRPIVGRKKPGEESANQRVPCAQTKELPFDHVYTAVTEGSAPCRRTT